ncbi:MAG: AsmA family protein [Pseudomonadota bacterium]
MFRFLRRTLYVLIGLIVVVFAGVFLIPAERILPLIQDPIEEATGYSVEITGRLRPSVYPAIGVGTGAIVVRRSGWEGGALLQAESVVARLSILPLLRGQFELAEVSVLRPLIRLEQTADGNSSWAAAVDDAAAAESVIAETAAEEPVSEPGADAPAPLPVQSFNISVIDAQVFVDDAVSGVTTRIDELHLNVSLDAIDAPLLLTGRGRWEAERFSLDATVETPEALLQNAPGRVSAEFDSTLGGLGLDVTIVDASTALPTLSGTATFAMSAPRRTVEVFDIAWPEQAGQVSDLRALLEVQSGVDGLVANLSSSLRRDGRGVAVTVLAAAPADVLEAQTLDLEVDLSVDEDVALRMAGSGAFADAPTFEGSLSAEVSGLADLLLWAGAGEITAADQTLDALSITSDVVLAPLDACTGLRNLSVTLDASDLGGSLCYFGDGPRPRVAVDIASTRLDLMPFLGEAPADAGEDGSGETSGAAETAEAEGWSDEPLPFELLDLVDADIVAAVETLIAPPFELGPLRLEAGLADSVLAANLSAEAFGGGGTTTIGANGAAQTVSFATDLRRVRIHDVLSVVLGGESCVRALGDAAADLSAEGESLLALVSSLDGTVSATLGEGRIQGVNLNAVTSVLSGEDASDGRTDFTGALAEFGVADGIMTTETLSMTAPFFRLEGDGTVDLPDQSLDLLMSPRLVADAEGQGGQQDRSGLGLPVRVSGPWSSPRFAPDFEEAERLRQIREAADAAARRAREAADAAARAAEDAAQEAEEAAREAAEERAQELEDAVEDRARDAVEGLFR